MHFKRPNFSLWQGFSFACLLLSFCIPNLLHAQCGALTIDDIAISQTGNSASLSWASTGASAYRFSGRSLQGGPYMSVTVTGTSYTLNNLPACAAFRYTIETLCADGSVGFSSEGEISTPGCPIQPTDIVATQMNSSTMRFSWPSTGASSYRVLYSSDQEPVEEVAFTDWGSIDVPLVNACELFQLTIYEGITPISARSAINPNCGGNSSSSNDCHAPSTSSLGASVNGTTATLSWEDSGADSYTVKYNLAGGTAYYSASAGSGTSVQLSNLSPCKSYSFSVQAHCNGSTISPQSGSTGFRTGPANGGTCPGASTCTNPSLSTSATCNSISLSWNDVGASSYNVIIYGPHGHTPDSPGPVTGTSYAFSGLLPGGSYTVQVVANCPDGGKPSQFPTITLPECCTVGPLQVGYNRVYPNVTIFWNDVGAETYDVELTSNVAEDDDLTAYGLTGTSHSFGGLKCGRSYSGYVTARCGSQQSAGYISFSSGCGSKTTATGQLQAASALSLEIMPQPAAAEVFLNLQVPEKMAVAIQVFDLRGQQVWLSRSKLYSPAGKKLS